MKPLVVLLIPLILSAGCVRIVPITQGDPADQSEVLFVQVLEAPEPQRMQALERLQSEYPHSPWTPRAKRIEELLRAQDTLTARIRDLERTNAGQLKKSRSLEAELERLRDDLEKLKQILIETEQRS